MNQPRTIFDMTQLLRQRERAARQALVRGEDAGWLHRLAAADISERIGDVARTFSRGLIVGSGGGAYAAALKPMVASLVQVEPAPSLARAAAFAAPGSEVIVAPLDPLPVAGTFDLAISGLWMHWANDPVGQLIQMRRALKPDGFLIAAMLGGSTLAELRAALAEAEAEVSDGLAPRVAPMGEIRDLGAILQRAGLAMPVADSLKTEARFETPLELMRELRAMGEGNALADRLKRPTRRAVLMRAAEIYAQHFGGPDGRVRARFELIFLTGWAPADGQPVALRPGSASKRLADALGTVEVPAGERAMPR